MGTATATSAFPTATFGGNITGTTSPVKIYPSTDSTTAVQVLKADGTTPIMTFDTTNKNVGIGPGGVPSATARLDVADTALAASGSLAGSVLNLAQTWNTTGTPTAIKLNVTNTASNAASLLMDLQVGGVSKFYVTNAGVITVAQGTFTNRVYTDRIINQTGTISTTPITIQDVTGTATSGNNIAVKIAPTYNQSSGTAANTDLLINRTETQVGSGAQNFVDYQVGGASRYSVDHNGQATTTGPNGSQWIRGMATELLTLSTAGTTTDTSANLLPANSVIKAVVARVTTTITTATDWKLGDATTAGRFTAADATMTAGETQVGLVHVDQTGAAGPKQTAAAKVRVTTTGTPGAGVIRITVYYEQFVAPTS